MGHEFLLLFLVFFLSNGLLIMSLYLPYVSHGPLPS
jgi:hypothetical protein